MMLDRIRLIAAAACAVSVAACSAVPTRPVPVPPPPSGAASTAEVEAIFTLLNRGDEATSRKRLHALLKRDPMNSAARVLSDSLDGDPKQLLGPDSNPYTVQAGDTIVGLAEHFLGNRLKAYQLGRYNGLTAPITLVAGQILRIPGEPPRVEAPRRPEAVRPSVAPPAASRPKPALAKPVAPGIAVNAAAARQTRTAGLAALNQGNTARAVGLLRRAAAFDPGNALIARDLARAERIAATVRARQ